MVLRVRGVNAGFTGLRVFPGDVLRCLEMSRDVSRRSDVLQCCICFLDCTHLFDCKALLCSTLLGLKMLGGMLPRVGTSHLLIPCDLVMMCDCVLWNNMLHHCTQSCFTYLCRTPASKSVSTNSKWCVQACVNCNACVATIVQLFSAHRPKAVGALFYLITTLRQLLVHNLEAVNLTPAEAKELLRRSFNRVDVWEFLFHPAERLLRVVNKALLCTSLRCKSFVVRV